MKTTKAQFDEFCEAVDFYVDLLHLGEWKVVKYHTDEFITEGSIAEMAWTRSNRIAAARFRKTLPAECWPEVTPWLHGKHEVLELLLSELAGAASNLYEKTEVECWVHAVIRRLEKALPGKAEA